MSSLYAVALGGLLFALVVAAVIWATAADRESRRIYSVAWAAVLLAVVACVLAVIALVWAFAPGLD